MMPCPDCGVRMISRFVDKCEPCQWAASARMLAWVVLAMLAAGVAGAWLAL